MPWPCRLRRRRRGASSLRLHAAHARLVIDALLLRRADALVRLVAVGHRLVSGSIFSLREDWPAFVGAWADQALSALAFWATSRKPMSCSRTVAAQRVVGLALGFADDAHLVEASLARAPPPAASSAFSNWPRAGRAGPSAGRPDRGASRPSSCAGPSRSAAARRSRRRCRRLPAPAPRSKRRSSRTGCARRGGGTRRRAAAEGLARPTRCALVAALDGLLHHLLLQADAQVAGDVEELAVIGALLQQRSIRSSAPRRSPSRAGARGAAASGRQGSLAVVLDLVELFLDLLSRGRSRSWRSSASAASCP